MTLLLVEDDEMIRDGLAEYLRNEGYEVKEASDGGEAMIFFDPEVIKLVILDIQLPVLNGLEVLKRIREMSKVPVLMLTAFTGEDYKVAAFSSLADGYVEKPFSLPVVKAQIDALMERYYGQDSVFQYKETVVDFQSYSATVNDHPVKMNPKEIEILQCLVMNQGQVLSRGQIIDQVWKDSDEIPFDRVIDVYIKELRRKLNLDCIVTVRNVGYKLEK